LEKRKKMAAADEAAASVFQKLMSPSWAGVYRYAR
jgi:hypothetical protein